MKKIEKTNLIIIILIILLGFSIYYNLNRDSSSDYLIQEKCAKSASEYFKILTDEKFDLIGSNYSNHYNKKIKKCLLFTNFTWKEGTHKYIHDAIEKRELGVFSYLNTGETSCYLKENKNCTNLFDFSEKLEEYLSE